LVFVNLCMHALGFTIDDPVSPTEKISFAERSDVLDFPGFVAMNPMNALASVKAGFDKVGEKVSSLNPLNKGQQQEGEAVPDIPADPNAPVDEGAASGGAANFFNKAKNLGSNIGSKIGGLMGQQGANGQPAQTDEITVDGTTYGPPVGEDGRPVDQATIDGSAGGFDKLKNFGSSMLNYGKQAGDSIVNVSSGAISQIKNTVSKPKPEEGGN